MPILVDCPGCAVLIRGDERSCPFCGVTLQRTTGVVAVLGLALGLMTASCGDKGGPSSDGMSSTDGTVSVSSTTASTGTSDASDSNTTVETGDLTNPTTAYAGPDTSVSESETNDPSVGSAYAASGESESVSDGTDTSSSSGSTGDSGSTGSTGDAGSTGDTEDTSGGSSG